MKKLLFTLTLVASTLFLFSSCRGPQGPAGPQGLQGNANVNGSDPFDVFSSEWLFSSGENAFYTTRLSPDITNAVATRGVVEAFVYYPADQTWRNLPDIYNGTQFYFRFSSGGFEIYYGNVNGTTPTRPTSTFTFRIVVIAPSFKQAHPNTNWKDYKQVQQLINKGYAEEIPVTLGATGRQ